LRQRLRYYRRIFAAYLGPGRSQLTFWHEDPQVEPTAQADGIGPFYMTFRDKANYSALLDASGIPLLDYRGSLGPQYNPIAIAQYGLGNYNAYRRTGDAQRRARFLHIAEWMATNLELNPQGFSVWMHHFDWEYRDTLRAPWYSALAQGNGISLLTRAYAETNDIKFLDAATAAFEVLLHDVKDGGVAFTDAQGDLWLEEYIVDPPTHILNGFIWATWGIYDYWLVTRSVEVRDLFEQCVNTITAHLQSFDTGYWSKYELSGTMLPMIASTFYHRLHITQLNVMEMLTGAKIFSQYADKWQCYAQHPLNRSFAKFLKVAFKLLYY